MEQKLITFFEKVNQIRKGALSFEGAPKDKMDYLINKMNVLLTSGEYEIYDWENGEKLDSIPETDTIEEYQLKYTTCNGKEISLDTRIEGIIFHIFVLFDGCNSLNDLNNIFIFDKKDNSYLNRFTVLHEEWGQYLYQLEHVENC